MVQKKQDQFFSQLIESGEFRVDSDGHALLNGQFLLMIPPHVILSLQERLSNRLGEAEMQEFMVELGEYQVEHALQRYAERYGIESLSADKFLDYAQNILRILGWGTIQIEDLNRESSEFRATIKHPTLPSVYRDDKDTLSDNKICHYVRGIFLGSFEHLFDESIQVEEKHCAATGGKECTFVGSPTN